jgi:hypothetical protein
MEIGGSSRDFPLFCSDIGDWKFQTFFNFIYLAFHIFYLFSIPYILFNTGILFKFVNTNYPGWRETKLFNNIK